MKNDRFQQSNVNTELTQIFVSYVCAGWCLKYGQYAGFSFNRYGAIWRKIEGNSFAEWLLISMENLLKNKIELKSNKL